MKEEILQFFNDIWNLVSAKQNESIYNTVCLVVLLTLPLVIIFTSLLICCHCCCCRNADRSPCCCCKGETSVPDVKSEKRKKKNGNQNEEDLWISVKTDPISNERLALTMV
ncbi:uncharacterized protein KIAA0040 [Carassius gibelio]|uniref:uncharacterized protein KIAA0040 n=1 Tax=Carassius gibelio TaxID=101364 RepID=UPI002279E6D0|nr:uncharacterized protein KIAA0040 [Carassius gibelio]XP_052475000.1 uncharacterized protein KIAA0040 [Carassius gibelio]